MEKSIFNPAIKPKVLRFIVTPAAWWSIHFHSRQSEQNTRISIVQYYFYRYESMHVIYAVCIFSFWSHQISRSHLVFSCWYNIRASLCVRPSAVNMYTKYNSLFTRIITNIWICGKKNDIISSIFQPMHHVFFYCWYSEALNRILLVDCLLCSFFIFVLADVLVIYLWIFNSLFPQFCFVLFLFDLKGKETSISLFNGIHNEWNWHFSASKPDTWYW